MKGEFTEKSLSNGQRTDKKLDALPLVVLSLELDEVSSSELASDFT